MTKEERRQFEENQKIIDSMMTPGTDQETDSNSDTHAQVTAGMDAFAVAEEEMKRKAKLRQIAKQ